MLFRFQVIHAAGTHQWDARLLRQASQSSHPRPIRADSLHFKIQAVFEYFTQPAQYRHRSNLIDPGCCFDSVGRPAPCPGQAQQTGGILLQRIQRQRFCRSVRAVQQQTAQAAQARPARQILRQKHQVVLPAW